MEKKVRFGIIGVGVQGSAYAGFLTGKGKTADGTVPPCPEHGMLGALGGLAVCLIIGFFNCKRGA